MGFRFLHSADLHLDTPFAGLGATSPEVAALLRDASLLAFDDLVRTAVAQEVDALILAGDVYDGAERGVRAQLRVHRGLRRLAERGIRTFVASGNHDPIEEGWSAIRDWPDLVTVFPAGRTESVRVERDGRHLATVHGTSYARRAETENLALRFSPGDHPGPHVAVLHANVGGDPDHDPYSPCSVEDLVRAGMDYWALGHIHTHRVLHREPWIVYPGTIQGRSPRLTETGVKGAVLVEIADDGTISEPELVPLDRVRFDHAVVDVAGLADVGALRDRLDELGERRLAESAGRSLVLGVRLVGTGPLHADLRRPGAVGELLAALRDGAPTGVPLLWWNRLEDATSARRDLDALRGRNDFVADLLEEAGRPRDHRAVEERWASELPADLALLLGDDLPDPAEPGRWEAARDLAIDLVAGDEG